MFVKTLKEDYNRLWTKAAEHDGQLSCSVSKVIFLVQEQL